MTQKDGSYFFLLLTILLIRLATLGLPDLLDTTEGRYASTASIMAERNDWITPWILVHGVEQPYLGKPPLHFWMMRAAYIMAGPNSLTARLPSFLSMLAIMVTLYLFSKQKLGKQGALASSMIFSSSLLPFVLGGLCLLDVTLTVGVTLSIAGFCLADRSRLAGYLCFVGLAIGFLAKGPVALVFSGIVVAPWALLRRWTTGCLPPQVERLPWVSGPVLFIGLAAPWYLLEETRNPGFLKYFFWTENMGRLLQEGYGDRYGSGHRQFPGAAWGMMIPSLLPWSLALGGAVFENRKRVSARSWLEWLKQDEWLLLGFLWSISSPVLLLFATQYTATYNMTAMPGFAFLMGVLWKMANEPGSGWTFLSRNTTRVLLTGMFVLGWGATVIFMFLRPSPPMWETSVALVGGLALLATAALTPVFKNALSPVTVTAVSFSMTIAIVLLSGDRYLSNHRSTREILALAGQVSGGSNVKVGFLNQFPFSARFYGPLLSGPSAEVFQVEASQLASTKADLIVVSGKDGQGEGIRTDSSWEDAGNLGIWTLYRKRRGQTGNSVLQASPPPD